MKTFKKAFALILTVVMLLSLPAISFADSDNGRIIFLKIDGETFDLTSEIPQGGYYGYNLPFAAIMRRLGYTVEYNEVFDYVTAKNGENEFLIEHGEIYYVKGEEKTIVPNSYVYINYQNVTVIGADFFSEALHYYADTYNNYKDNVLTICLTDLRPYSEKMVKTTKNIISKYEAIGVDYHNINQQFTSVTNFSFISKLFGSTVTSDITTDGSIKINDNKLNYVYNLNTEGLANIWDVMLKIAQSGGFYDEDKKIEFAEGEFDKPISVEIFADDNGMLIKSDLIAGSFMYDMTDEQKEKLKGKWVEVPQNEYIDTFTNSFDYNEVLSKPETYEKLLTSILTGLETNKTTEALTLITETYDDILNNCLTLEVKENNIYNVRFSIDKTKISEVAIKFASTIPLGNYNGVEVDESYLKNQVDSAKEILDLMEISIIYGATIENGIIKTTDSSYEFLLKNIPNPYKIPIGELKISSKFTSKNDPSGNITLKRPELKDIVTIEDLESMRSGNID